MKFVNWLATNARTGRPDAVGYFIVGAIAFFLALIVAALVGPAVIGFVQFYGMEFRIIGVALVGLYFLGRMDDRMTAREKANARPVVATCMAILLIGGLGACSHSPTEPPHEKPKSIPCDSLPRGTGEVPPPVCPPSP